MRLFCLKNLGFCLWCWLLFWPWIPSYAANQALDGYWSVVASGPVDNIGDRSVSNLGYVADERLLYASVDNQIYAFTTATLTEWLARSDAPWQFNRSLSVLYYLSSSLLVGAGTGGLGNLSVLDFHVPAVTENNISAAQKIKDIAYDDQSLNFVDEQNIIFKRPKLYPTTPINEPAYTLPLAPTDEVRKLYVYPAGNSGYIAGKFIGTGSVALNHLARWFIDETDTPGVQNLEFGVGNSAAACQDNCEVKALVYDDVRKALYVGGIFSKQLSDGQTVQGIAKWDELNNRWLALGGGVNAGGEVRALSLNSMQGILYVAGKFTTIGGVAANNIARFNLATQTWSALGTGGGLLGEVNALAWDTRTRSLFAGGNFTAVDTLGNGQYHVARWQDMRPVPIFNLSSNNDFQTNSNSPYTQVGGSLVEFNLNLHMPCAEAIKQLNAATKSFSLTNGKIDSYACAADGETVIVRVKPTAINVLLSIQLQDSVLAVPVTINGNQTTVGNYASDQLSNIQYVDDQPPAPVVLNCAMEGVLPKWHWVGGGGGAGHFSYRLQKAGQTNDLDTNPDTLTVSYAPSGVIPAGIYTLFVKERDQAGNWSTEQSCSLNVQVKLVDGRWLSLTNGASPDFAGVVSSLALSSKGNLYAVGDFTAPHAYVTFKNISQSTPWQTLVTDWEQQSFSAAGGLMGLAVVTEGTSERVYVSSPLAEFKVLTVDVLASSGSLAEAAPGLPVSKIKNLGYLASKKALYVLGPSSQIDTVFKVDVQTGTNYPVNIGSQKVFAVDVTPVGDFNTLLIDKVNSVVYLAGCFHKLIRDPDGANPDELANVNHVVKWRVDDEALVNGLVVPKSLIPLGGGLEDADYQCFVQSRQKCKVQALALGENNSLYVGGSFHRSVSSGSNGSAKANSIAKWSVNEAGVGTWSALGSGIDDDPSVDTLCNLYSSINNEFNCLVNALAFDEDAQILYAGGKFAYAGGVLVNNLAKWDVNLQKWQNLMAEDNGLLTVNNSQTNTVPKGVKALAFDRQSRSLFVGGDFTAAGGIANTPYLAQWQDLRPAAYLSLHAQDLNTSHNYPIVFNLQFSSVDNTYIDPQSLGSQDFNVIGGKIESIILTNPEAPKAQEQLWEIVVIPERSNVQVSLQLKDGAVNTLPNIFGEYALNHASKVVSTLYVDQTPPLMPVVTSESATSTNKLPIWSWRSGGGDGVQIFKYYLAAGSAANGGIDDQLYGAETNAVTFTPPSPLNVDSYTLYVKERDAAGNWSPPGSFTVKVINSPFWQGSKGCACALIGSSPGGGELLGGVGKGGVGRSSGVVDGGLEGSAYSLGTAGGVTGVNEGEVRLDLLLLSLAFVGLWGWRGLKALFIHKAETACE